MSAPYRIVITSQDGQTPRRLPKAVTLSARWSFQRFGGMWDAVITAAATLTQLATIKISDRVEIYVSGPGQLALPDGTPLPEWRGYITGRSRSKQNAETVVLQAFGAIHFVRGFPANKNYATAYPADVATFFGQVGDDFVLNVPGPGGVPLITTIDAGVIGTTRSVLNAEFVAVGAALDDLERGMGNLAGYGCDIDPHAGGNRLYLRANSPLDPPTHALPAPARKLTQLGSEEDGQGVATVLQITGGQPDYPQLLHNGNFALPIRHTALSSNLLRNGDFEATTDWTLSGPSGQQAAYKNADFRGTYKHQPFSGAQQIELDHVGEFAEQTGSAAFVAGRNYILAVRASKGFGNQVADGHGLLEWQDANNAVIGAALTFPLTPASVTWDYFSLTATAPTGAARYRVHFELDHIAQGAGNSNIGGLYLDAAELYDASQVSQDGMEAELQGGAVINAINWIYGDAAYEGAYCLYLDVTAADDNDHDVPVQPLHAARFPVSPQQTIRFRYRYRSPNAGSGPLPRMQAELEFYAGDGRSTNASKIVVPAQPNNTNWQYAEAVATGQGSSVSARVSANLRGSGKILIDALSAMDAAAPSDPYQADGPYKVTVACNDADLLAAYPAGAAIYGSRYADYGPQVSSVTEEAILTRADALAYADNFFRGSGPYKRPPLTLDGDLARYYPGESLLLLGADGPALMDAALPIARVERSGADTLLTTLDIEREARDETQIINAMIDNRLAKKGTGTASASGGGYSSQSNSGTGLASGATPAFRTTLQASPADATLHDAYTAAPHASQSSQDGWTGTTSEVVAARTRTARAVSSTTLEGRLDAMEVDIAAVVGGMEYQGTWNASTNSPALANGIGTKGFYYKVSVAGSTTLDGNSAWHVGDWAAFDGTTWDKIDNFEAVTSVAGRVGAVTLSSTDIAGLGSAATQPSTAFDAAGAATATQAASLQKSSNLSDLASTATARNNLGLGTAAVANLPAAGSNATTAQAVRGDDTRLGAKREWPLQLPVAQAASSSPSLTFVARAPFGPNGAVINWILESAPLSTETPNATPTTIMPVWSPGGNAAFGPGTPLLSAPLTISGATTYTGSAPPANISATPVPSGSRVALIVSAAGAANSYVSLQWREQ